MFLKIYLILFLKSALSNGYIIDEGIPLSENYDIDPDCLNTTDSNILVGLNILEKCTSELFTSVNRLEDEFALKDDHAQFIQQTTEQICSNIKLIENCKKSMRSFYWKCLSIENIKRIEAYDRLVDRLAFYSCPNLDKFLNRLIAFSMDECVQRNIYKALKCFDSSLIYWKNLDLKGSDEYCEYFFSQTSCLINDLDIRCEHSNVKLILNELMDKVIKPETECYNIVID